MVAAASAGGVRLMIAQSRRYIGHLRRVKAMAEQIGPLSGALYTFAANFDVNIAPAWWRSKEATGGLVYPMLASHSIDFLLWLCPNRKPVSVFAQGTDANSDFEGDDAATIIMKFDDGLVTTSYLSINSRIPRHEVLITGDTGSIYASHSGDHGGGLVGIPDTDVYLNGRRVLAGPSEPHAFAVQMTEFLSAILEEREPESSGASILTQIRVLDAAQKSAREQKVIML